MNDFFYFLLSKHYLDVLIIFFALFAFFHIVKFKPKGWAIYLFSLYILSGLYLFSFGNAYVIKNFWGLKNEYFHTANELNNAFFCTSELVAFSTFFYFSFKNAYQRSATIFLILINIVYLLHFISTLFDKSNSNQFIWLSSILLNILELITLFILCIFFYYSTMKSTTSLFPKNKAILWIVNSLFFYIILSLPFFIIIKEIRSVNREFYVLMYVIHYLALTNLFLWIGLALRTKKSIME